MDSASKFGGDAWLELQAFKTRQINRRERLNRHKDLINGIATGPQHAPSTNLAPNIQVNAVNTAESKHDRELCQNIDLSLQASTSSSKQNKIFIERAGTSENASNESKSPRKQLKNDHSSLPSDFDSSFTKCSTHDDNRSALGVGTVECLLILKLCDVALKLPIDSKSLQRSICKVKGLEKTQKSTIENLLEKLAHQELITIEQPSSVLLNRGSHQVVSNNDEQDEDSCIHVIAADHSRLVEFDKTFGSSDNVRSLLLETRTDDLDIIEIDPVSNVKRPVPIQTIKYASTNPSQVSENDKIVYKSRTLQREFVDLVDYSSGTSISHHNLGRQRDDVESLLSLSSTRERESKRLGEELLELLSKPTAKERNLLERFRSADGYQVQEFCPKGTKDDCKRNNKGTQACDKLHFKKIIAKHTEESLGDCSFLNTCFHMDSCKYVHYEVDCDDKRQLVVKRSESVKEKPNRKTKEVKSNNIEWNPELHNANSESKSSESDTLGACDDIKPAIDTATKYTLSPEEQLRIDIRNRKRYKTVLYPPQWIQCDLRYFDMSLLGKFSVVMADPPWDIHMELPYGTMSDDEMRKLNIPALQDEGVIFLWVTGRAMELGRECLALWGYERCDEIIWVKTNQLQRIIRTGRTGHWLNHGKEHCLVGVKGNPTDINRGLDCDIIVAEVRATSHKPDEIYGIIERLSPGTRKIELFGRAHNVQPNWITLGNQLNGVRLVEPSLIEAFKKQNLPT